MTAVHDAQPDEETESTLVIPAVLGEREERFRPKTGGWVGRGLMWALLAWVVLAMPGNVLSPFELGVADIDHFSMAAIFAIVGLSLNVLIGYAGTISFGHQAFVGIGAFTAAYIVVDLKLDFWLAVPIAAIIGGLQAAALGGVSLRVSGLYFALVTFAYGAFAEQTLFNITELTGGEAGKTVERPLGFEDASAYYYLCVGFLALVLWLDWRLTRTKGGRALQALRENPRVASSYGVNVKAYTVLAFVTSGVFAAIAGALMAHNQQLIVPQSFSFQLGLVFILMTVVGGLRNRTGVVLGGVVFALLDDGFLIKILPDMEFLPNWLRIGWLIEDGLGLPLEFIPFVIGPILLILTITLFPGGIGEQVAPIKEWLLGRRFNRHAGKVREVEVTDVRA